MNFFRAILFAFSFGILICSCDSWIDFTSENWKLEPQYISNTFISFGEESNSQTIYISNIGEHNQISFNIIVTEKWIIPSITSGTINKNEDKSVKIVINRSYLKEGSNSGELKVYIDNNLWTIPVTAIGINKIEISQSHINFGSVDDTAVIKIRSLSGARDLEIIPSADWLSVSEKFFFIEEYNDYLSETEKTITIKCKRGLLEEGEHTSSVEILSGHGAKLFSIPITVTIPSQSEFTVAVDNYVFSLSKHLYWENNNVVLELKIKNHKYLKLFELVNADSYAISEERNYTIRSASVGIQPNSEETMKIYIMDVNKSVTSFSNITLTFRDLSTPIIFQNVELQ